MREWFNDNGTDAWSLVRGSKLELMAKMKLGVGVSTEVQSATIKNTYMAIEPSTHEVLYEPTVNALFRSVDRHVRRLKCHT